MLQLPARLGNPEVVVGAAQRIDLTSKVEIERVAKRAQAWQTEAWAYFDTIGEIKYAARFMGNAVGRCRLFAAYQVAPDEPPISVLDAADPKREGGALIPMSLAIAANEELARVQGSQGGQAQIANELAINLFLVGEAYLVGRNISGTEEEVWEVYSESELKADASGGLMIVDGESSNAGEKLGQDDFVIRIWRKHARFGKKADSNMRSVLNECEELQILSRAIRSSGRSRLNAGLLFVPSELSFDTVKPEDVESGMATEDQFDLDLMETMTAPIADDGSPAGVVPLTIRGKAEYGKEIRHITVDRPIDKETLERSGFILRRLAAGIDLPAEILSGLADLNHWTAWLVDESAYKSHIEPTASLGASGICVGALRPLLIERSFPSDLVKKIIIAIDPSALVNRPNRAADAKEAHSALALSDSALLRELGFSDDDKPDDDEVVRRLGVNRSIISAELSQKLLQLAELLPPGDLLADPSSDGSEPAPVDPPATDDSGSTGPPESEVTAAGAQPDKSATDVELALQLIDLDRALRSRLMVACDEQMKQVLSRAGAKLRSKAPERSHERAVIASIPNHLVAATLGPSLVGALVDEEVLLNDAFDSLQEQYGYWVSRTQMQSRRLAGINDALTEDQLAALEAREEENRSEGWIALQVGLVALASNRLYDPKPDAPALGEFDPTLSVPPALIRQSMAVAGGAPGVSIDPSAGSVRVDSGESPAGGVATGALVSNTIVELRGPAEEFVWVYGDSGSRQQPFMPHEALDGETFRSWQDDVLLIGEDGDWIGGSHYAVGDHEGCQCDFMIVPAAESTDEGETDALDTE